MATNIVSSGKVIGYLLGWETPPTAAALLAAGYTHVIVAFGVFSLTSPGEITSAFSTISAEYITTLKQVGIKVLLSVGGASTSVPDTTVDFNQVLSLAASLETFQNTFINSFQNLVSTYGFDGIDFDIEHGFNDPAQPLNNGTTFQNPIGDVRVVANIINALHDTNPSLLISLTPQSANISPTPAFNQTWANYSGLVMLTAPALSWVGIQLYNTGGMYGINQQIYSPSVNNATVATSPDFSVAMAVDLLENWPSQIAGRATGWLNYIGQLKPEQIVLGYPVPNSTGISDGAPSAPPNVINRAIQCLRTGVAGSNSCDTYIPPKTYPAFGGVFCWNINDDASNNYAFAKGVKDTINNGTAPVTPPVTPPITRKLTITISNNGANDVVIQPSQNITITLN